MFVTENGVSKPKNTDTAVYQPPSLKGKTNYISVYLFNLWFN